MKKCVGEVFQAARPRLYPFSRLAGGPPRGRARWAPSSAHTESRSQASKTREELIRGGRNAAGAEMARCQRVLNRRNASRAAATLPGTADLPQQPRPGMQHRRRPKAEGAERSAPEGMKKGGMATCFYMVRSWHRSSGLLGGCRRFVEPVSPRLCIKTIL